MSVLPVIRVFIVLLLTVGGMGVSGTAAQEEGTGVVVATGLTNPRGALTVGDLIFVAMAGSGGSTVGTDGWAGGPTSAVALIDGTGCATGIATGLPSSLGSAGAVLGASDVAILGDQLYAVVDGGGEAFGNSGQPSGVYRLLADEEAQLVAELPAGPDADLVSQLGDAIPAASFGMVADGVNEVLWVVDSRTGEIVTVAPDGTITAVATLTEDQALPTRPVLDGSGGIYVGTMGQTPLVDGSASVVQVSLDGTVSEVWSDLTAVVDVAVDDAGTLYALEMSTGHTEDATGITPASGRLLEQTADGSEVIADGLAAPVALDLGLDGASLYVSMPGVGANDGGGVIVQFEGEAVAAGQCDPLAETLFQPEGDAATAVPAAPTELPSTPAVPPTPTPTPTPEPDVVMTDFTFSPAVLEVEVGQEITFFNNDAVAHTVTAENGSFDTGNIAPGQFARLTFETPGTYTYVCSYHAGMPAATIVVVAPATPVASPVASPSASPAASPAAGD